MKTYNRYENGIDHTWYDSSNIIYSQCCDKGDKKSLRIVFKGGRVYLYRNVEIGDYILMRDSASTGESANKNIIKKYQSVRLEDVDLAKLEEMKSGFIEQDKIANERNGNLKYHLEANNKTGEFRLKNDGVTVYEGIEGQVSIFKLFASLQIPYSMSELETPISTVEDFEKENLLEVRQTESEEIEC